jgi:dihydroflavonol-4-reductase
VAGTVLVTGGSGFIAGWCVVQLLERGYDVRTTVRDAAKEQRVRDGIAGAQPAADRLSFAVADLNRDEGWDAAVAGCEYVLHVASPLGGGIPGDRNSLIAPARDGTLRVLRAAAKAGIKRVVMTSAAAAARPPLTTDRMSDESIWSDPEDPQFDAYRVSKILAERAAWDFMEREGGTTQLTTILPGAVFGPILTAENLGSVQIIQGMLNGKPPALPRLGFWIVDVRDLADLHIRAMTASSAAGQRFIAAGDYMWMEDIARTLRTGLGEAGSKTPTRRLPDFVVRLLLPFAANLRSLAPLLGRRFPLTSDKARQTLGFRPRPAAITVVDCARSLLPV